MADVAIRETTVIPDAFGQSVQLQIADVLPPYEGASIHLSLTVLIPEYNLPLLAHIQREAIEIAVRELRTVSQAIATEIGRMPRYDIDPTIKKTD